MLKRLAVASLLVALLPLRGAALDTQDLLSLVAMPLAVAAAAELTDVPRDQLIDVVTLLNQAQVPPAQFVEVVRYVPVALVTTTEGPTFVEFVRARELEGLRGTQLVTVIEDRFRAIGVPADLDVVAPRVVQLDQREFIPQIVRTRIAEAKTHPHGGPPGQLKKIAGVQTGAEIVHGEHPGKGHAHHERVVVAQPRHDVEREVIHVTKEKPHGHGGGDHGDQGDHGNRGMGQGGGNGGGKGKGKGKG